MYKLLQKKRKKKPSNNSLIKPEIWARFFVNPTSYNIYYVNL